MRGWGLFFFVLFILLIISATAWVLFTQLRARRSGLPPPSWRSYIPFLKSHGSGSGGAFANFPTPRSSNPVEWVRDKIAALRQGRNRTAEGHYEEAGGYGGGGGGAGAGLTAYGGSSGGRPARGMDPDEAWDTRVGNEADAYGAGGPGGYYEEQEIGLAPTSGLSDPYGSHHRGAALPAYGEGADTRGRSKSRDPAGVIGGQQGLDTRYEQEMGVGGSQQRRAGGDANNPFSDAHEAGSLRGISPRPMVDSSVAQAQGGKAKGGGGGQEESPTERRSMFRESL